MNRRAWQIHTNNKGRPSERLLFSLVTVRIVLTVTLHHIIEDWNRGLFATFVPPQLTDKSSAGRLSPLRFSKSGVQPCGLCEDSLQHIAIDTIVLGDVLCPALEGLFAERLAVEAHVVEV